MPDTPQISDVRWFRSKPHAFAEDAVRIDAEAGVIYDVVMAQEGEAKGHGVHLDADFIENLVKYDKINFSTTGLKSRFGHPSASSETMGTQLGVYKNFRKREKEGKMQAIADLHLLEAAAASPTHGDMRSWVLQMAAERPDFIMSSIVFRGSGFYQRKGNGNKKRVYEYDAENVYQEPDTTLGPVYVDFNAESGAAHYFTDLVESGAATENLFAATQFSPHLFVSRADEWLNDNPDILQFIRQNPQKLFSIIEKLGISPEPKPQIIQPQKGKSMSFFKKMFFGQEVKPDTQVPEEMLTALEAADKQVGELQVKFAEQDKTIVSLVKQLSALTDRVATVEQFAPDATQGDTPPAANQSYQSIGVPEVTAFKKMPGLK